MTTIDLRRAPPPRWSDAIDGVAWLPRLAAKVRAHDAGMLGTYVLGQSPVDDDFLRVARVDYAGFIEIVRAAAGDAAVLSAVCGVSPDSLERLRRWSIDLPKQRGLALRIMDADDGYDRPKWLNAPIAFANVLLRPLLVIARRVRPLKA